MRLLFAFLFLFLQFTVFGQHISSQFPPSDSVYYSGKQYADPQKTENPDPLIRKSYKPSRELKLLGKSAIIISAVSTAGLLTYHFADEPLREFSLENRTAAGKAVSGTFEFFGRSPEMVGAAGLVYGTGLLTRNPKLQRTGILIASSILVNDYVTRKLKLEFQRHRPDRSAENDQFEGGEGGGHNMSFPSAHTSTAFTIATSIAINYKDHKWVPPLAYAGATLVGLSRIYDNKHWATDVLAGAAVGFLTAKGTNFLLTQTEKLLKKKNLQVYLTPRVSTQAAGLNLSATF